MSSADYAAQVSRGMKPQSNVERSGLKESRAIDDLAIAHEVVDDIITREQAFNSKAESIFLLGEGRSLISAQLKGANSTYRDSARSLAAKLAFAYLKLDQPSMTIAITQEVVASCRKEEESKLCDLWRPIVSLAYKLGLYDAAAQLASMLCLHSTLSGSWMSVARLQSMLRLSEEGKHKKNRDLHNADTLWEAYEREGLAVPETAMVILLDSQVRRGDIAKVTQTLEAMKRHNIHITSDVFKELLWYSLRGKKRQAIRKLIFNSIGNINTMAEKLLQHFSRESKLRDCLRVLRMFGIATRGQDLASSSFVPTFRMYSSMIGLFLRIDQPRHVIRYLDLALEYGSQGDYTSLFIKINHAFYTTSKAEEALHLGFGLLNSPLRYEKRYPTLIQPLSNTAAIIEPSGRVYGALLRSVSCLLDVSRIVRSTQDILLEMFSLDIKIDAHVRKALTMIIIRLGRNADVQSLVRYMRRLFVRLDGEHADEWNRLVETMQRDGVADELTLEAWKKSASRSRKYEADSIPWTQSKASVGIPFHGPVRFSTLADVDPTTDETKELVSRIELRDLDLNVNLSPAAYAMRIRVFAVLRREFDNALLIYQSMAANGVQATMHHVAPLVEGLILADRLADAHMIKDRAKVEFPDSGIPLWLYAALVRGYGQRQDWQALLLLAAEMRKEKVKITRSIQVAFQTAKRMLRQQAKVATEKGDRVALRRLKGLLKQPMPPRQSRRTPLSVLEATFTFNEYHQNGQSLLAQEHLSRALDDGLKPDAHLRDTLSRCDNWLRKVMQPMEGEESKARQYRYLEKCLEFCRINRQRMKMTREEEIASVWMRKQEERQRNGLIKLLRSALASDKLRMEAHSGAYQKKKTKSIVYFT